MAADEILIVSENINRYKAYRRHRRGKLADEGEPQEDALQRICRGVYMRKGVDREAFFQRYGLRIAHHLFPSASLSYATAFLRKPALGRVFVTGQYQYQRQLFDKSDRYVIVQSIGVLEPKNPKLHTMETFKDPYGKFEMLCDSPELTLLNMMTSTKRHTEKHLDRKDLDELIEMLLAKHKSKGNVASALEEVAAAAQRENEFRRIVTLLYSPNRAYTAG